MSPESPHRRRYTDLIRGSGIAFFFYEQIHLGCAMERYNQIQNKHTRVHQRGVMFRVFY